MRNANGTARPTAFWTRVQAPPVPVSCLPAAFDGSMAHRQECRSMTAAAVAPVPGVKMPRS
ncbi:MAG: hypothetical protein ACRDOH_23725 [Streptosporangiaceae bacterium]